MFVPDDKLPDELKTAPSKSSREEMFDRLQALRGKGKSEEVPKEDEPGLMRRALTTVRGMAPSIAGGMAGAPAGGAIGTMVAPGPGTAVGALIGQMLGSGGGEWLAQKMGWTEPSTGSILLSAAAPGVGKAVKPAYRFAKDFAISSFASRPVVAQAAESLLKKWLNPSVRAAELYEQAGRLGMPVPANKTLSTLDDILRKEVTRAPTTIRAEILEAIKPLRDYFAAPVAPPSIVRQAPKPTAKIVMGQSGYRGAEEGITRQELSATTQAAAPTRTGKIMSVPDLVEETQRLRLIASKAYDSGNTKFANIINSLRGAMLDDLEVGGAGVVKQAARAYRKEMALEDLGRLIGKSEPGTKIRDFARDNPLFKGAFDEKEMALIDKITKRVQFVVPTGMAGAAGRILTGGAGALATGSPWGALMAWAGPEAIRKMLASPKGQAFIERSLSSNYQMGPEWAAAAAMFARGLMAQEPEQTQ